MEISNAQEYQSVRDEMQNLKNCITNYLGYVLGGFGISFIGFFVIEDIRSVSWEPLAFISLILAITITMVLFIIYYKFNSHNRYAGYCKLLNQEQLNIWKKTKSDIDIMSWEICVSRLRESDLNDEHFYYTLNDMVSRKVIDDETLVRIKKYLGKKSRLSFKYFISGILILLGFMFGFSKNKSWHFPVPVTIVFLSLSVIYIAFSLYSMGHIYSINYNNITGEPNSSWIYILLLLVFGYMWATIFMRLNELMQGSLTVDAYCCKFLPIRYCFINQKSPSIKYSLITLKDMN